MASATCLLVEPRDTSRSLRPVVQRHGACFEVLALHTWGEVTHTIAHLDDVNFAIIDDGVPRADDIAVLLRHSYPDATIIVVSDEPTRDFSLATSVVPRDFPQALAVALRREAARRRQPS